MSIADTNAVIISYLTTSSVKTDPLIALVGDRIYCPSLPEKEKLIVAGVSTPAISFFTRGGLSTPYIPGIINPSVQFDCWAEDYMGLTNASIRARQVYRALYDALQGIQNVNAGTVKVVGTDGNDYNCILAHNSTPRNKPITGATYATYWTATGGKGIGAGWVDGIPYRLTYQIMSAIEEVQGQDLVDSDFPNYFRVLTFFEIMIRAE